ncbi:MAG: GDYXXLXY domain-containing protein, partial [Epsilonproteobacteria bacterium]|nr:GDYXXLXY domain-containing protein [Campylobacterota bacterium]
KIDKKNFDGIVVLLLDKNRVGKFVSFYNKHTKLILKPNYLKLKYKIRNGKVKIVTDSFFFQEEKAKIYQKAKYGKFKVDKEGNAILIGVVDKEFRELK